MFLDEEGPYWIAAKYMNDAYNRGILDPDSFIQTGTDFNTKLIMDRFLITTMHLARRLEVIPMKGTWMNENLFDIGGNCICITSTCKDKVAAIKLLDYLHSPKPVGLFTAVFKVSIGIIMIKANLSFRKNYCSYESRWR